MRCRTICSGTGHSRRLRLPREGAGRRMHPSPRSESKLPSRRLRFWLSEADFEISARGLPGSINGALIPCRQEETVGDRRPRVEPQSYRRLRGRIFSRNQIDHLTIAAWHGSQLSREPENICSVRASLVITRNRPQPFTKRVRSTTLSRQQNTY
jgi:hypothetical protein